MNERQKLDMMVLRSQIRAQEKLRAFAERWAGQEAVIAGEPKPYQGEINTPRITEEQNAS